MTLHALQAPGQLVSQHTPSTQLALWHCAPALQDWPLGRSAVHTLMKQK